MQDMLSELWAVFDQSTFVVASVLTVANLLAIWVGVSRRHWCLRLLVLAACGWAVIAARVYEGAAFLAVQGAGTFVLLAGFRRGRQDDAACGSHPHLRLPMGHHDSGRPAVGGFGEVGRPAARASELRRTRFKIANGRPDRVGKCDFTCPTCSWRMP